MFLGAKMFKKRQSSDPKNSPSPFLSIEIDSTCGQGFENSMALT